MSKTDLIHESATDPTVNDDSSKGFLVGIEWKNLSTNELFDCIDDSVGAAVWVSKKDIVLGGSVVIGDDAILDTAPFGVDQHNYDPPGWRVGGIIQKSFLIINPTSNIDITGIIPSIPEIRNKYTMFNNGTGTATLVNASGLSLPDYRFDLKNNIILQQKESIEIIRATINSKWIAVNV